MFVEKIENSLKKIEKDFDKENFIYNFLLSYDQPQSTINRLKKGDYNLSKQKDEVIWKKKIIYKIVENQDPHYVIDNLNKSSIVKKNKIRFIVVTDSKLFLAIDTKTKESLDIKINQISKHVDFFLPLMGVEKSITQYENLADVKAAEKMARLFDVVIKDNENLLRRERDKHGLNIFLVRLLFCFFSEDTGIFPKSLFTNSIKSYTAEDGSDLADFFKKLFLILNLESKKNFPEFFKSFPYVNGGLFQNSYPLPNFTRESRKMIIESGSLDWGSINPDILGSMMQAIVDSEDRATIGMHYTSVENILKLIKPLFLDDLYENFFKANDEKNLKKILKEIYNLIIFDPACGSGNFLVISYKELCKIEIEIFKKLKKLNKTEWSIGSSGIRLTQFYGIEKEDFAHEIAKVSLWLAEHQMNLFFKEIFGETKPSIPLSDPGNIICKNSVTFDWKKFCPGNTYFQVRKKKEDPKIYIIGNPPYKGARRQSSEQKNDMSLIFSNIKNYKNLDYVSAWFLISAQYINNTNNAFSAFVSTSSLFQGEQVSIFWEHILKLNIGISYAYKPFLWTNSAKGKAGVTCVIVGLSKKTKNKKYIFYNNKKIICSNISPYLTAGKDVIVYNRSRPLNKNTPQMIFGSMPNDGGNLILTKNERDEIIKSNPKVKEWIRPLVGSHEFFNGYERFCIWLLNVNKEKYKNIPEIVKRVEKIRILRSKSDRAATKKLSNTPELFGEIRQPKKGSYILYPSHSSENREYIPIDFKSCNVIATNTTHIIPEATLYEFGIIESKMHMTWMKCVSGRLKNDFNYSAKLVYNNFPWPQAKKMQKNIIEKCSLSILDEREKYSEKSLSQLYDPNKMPNLLKKAHINLDLEVEKIYRGTPFKDDSDRLEFLFNKYLEETTSDRLI